MVNVYTPEIIIADSAGFEKNYEDQVLLILTATKKNRTDRRGQSEATLPIDTITCL